MIYNLQKNLRITNKIDPSFLELHQNWFIIFWLSQQHNPLHCFSLVELMIIYYYFVCKNTLK